MKLSQMGLLVLMVALNGMVQGATVREDFEGQPLPSTDTPPGRWIFMDVENQPGTYYEAVARGNGAAGRIKADVVVNTFFAAGYIVHPTGTSAAQPFSGSFDVLLEDEGSWSDGLFMFGDILNGHTAEYYMFKYVGSGNATALYDSDYPDTAQINVLNTGFSMAFTTWYTTNFTWTPTNGTTGSITFEIQDQDGTVLVTSSVDIMLPDTVYFGFGSSNDAVRVDNVIIRYTDPAQASNPYPGDGHADVAAKGHPLSWTSGIAAHTHDIYLGTGFDDVNNADRTNTLGVLASQGQTANTLEAGKLDFLQTYYWRVDEVNAAPDNAIHKGDVWRFTVEPYAIMIPVDVNHVTASSSVVASPPGMVVNGSGLDGSTHATDSDTMWLSAAPELDPWLMFEFDRLQKLDHMLIWNSNGTSESFVGWGIKDVNIETSVDGVTWTALAEAGQVSRAPGQPTYNAPQVIDLNLALARYVRLNILNNWGGLLNQYGVSEVQFFGLPLYARTPAPASGSVDVLPNTTVTWRAGREADEHTVTVGTDANALTSSVSSTTNRVDLTSLDLQLDQTYYWRVDEVNVAETPSVWTGDVWSFSTVPYVTVEDFESYGNLSPNRPFQTWVDGYGYSADEFFPVEYTGNGTGSGVGHDIWSPSSPQFDGTIMEGTLARSGQSLPLYFNNTGGVSLSETTRIFDTAQDWTANGIQSLSLSLYGDPGNTGQLYLKINNAKLMAEHVALDAAQWQTWSIDLTAVNTDLSQVTSLTVGIEGSGASGVLYLDDIRLSPTVNSSLDIGSERAMLNNGGTLASQWIRSDSPEDIKGAAMFIGGLPTGADLRGILAFSLAVFQQGDVIGDVTVSLFHGTNGVSNHRDGSLTSSSLEIALITNPAYTNNRASWNNADQDALVAWNRPGGDFGTPLATVTGLNLTTLDADDEVTFSSAALTAAVQAAVDAGDSQITFVLRSPDLEEATTRNFFVFQGADASGSGSSIGPNLHVDLE